MDFASQRSCHVSNFLPGREALPNLRGWLQGSRIAVGHDIACLSTFAQSEKIASHL
jgi:hypothetical protein